jgi:hypothetical protein
MATFYSNQYQEAFITIPSVNNRPGDVSGHILCAYADFTVPAVAPIANDVFKLCKIPKGARVVEVYVAFPDLGTTGLVDIGYSASVDGVETASATAFLASVDVNTAAAIVCMSEQANPAGFGKLFASEVDLELKVNTAWTAVAGTVKVILHYRIV